MRTRKKARTGSPERIQTYSDRQVMRSPGYEVYHYVDRAFRRIDLHHHDFYELYFFVSGEVEYHIEGRIYRLHAGDIVLIHPTALHQARMLGEISRYDRMVLWIDKDFLRGLSSEKTDLASCFDMPGKSPVLSPDPAMRQELRSLMERLLALDREEAFGRDLLARALITELLVRIRRAWPEAGSEAESGTDSSRLIDAVIAHIETHLADPLSLEALSEQFFLSKYHLSREFRKYAGVGLHRYIVLKRLIAAKGLILADEPVKTVCAACGFGEESTFYRCFRDAYGMTPKQFRALRHSDQTPE